MTRERETAVEPRGRKKWREGGRAEGVEGMEGERESGGKSGGERGRGGGKAVGGLEGEGGLGDLPHESIPPTPACAASMHTVVKSCVCVCVCVCACVRA
jgi:hypothetical protein